MQISGRSVCKGGSSKNYLSKEILLINVVKFSKIVGLYPSISRLIFFIISQNAAKHVIWIKKHQKLLKSNQVVCA